MLAGPRANCLRIPLHVLALQDNIESLVVIDQQSLVILPEWSNGPSDADMKKCSIVLYTTLKAKS